MVKSMNLGKVLKKNLRKVEKMTILKSSVTLYVTLLAALMTVLVYISKSDWNSLIVLIASDIQNDPTANYPKSSSYISRSEMFPVNAY